MNAARLTDRKLCRQQFDEALAKANSAHSAEVRLAYFDLASFYQRQLSGQPALLCPKDAIDDRPARRAVSL